MSEYHLTLRKGITERVTMIYRDSQGDPVNLSGYQVRSMGRDSMESPVPIFHLTRDAGITVVNATGSITLEWDASETANYERLKNGVWSLEVESTDGTVTELLAGYLHVEERATRE